MPEKTVDLQDIINILASRGGRSIHRTTVWRMVQRGTLPKPVMKMGKYNRWVEKDVLKMIEKLYQHEPS